MKLPLLERKITKRHHFSFQRTEKCWNSFIAEILVVSFKAALLLHSPLCR